MDPSGSRDPVLLVPTIQLEQFLKFTNMNTGRNLSIPRGHARDKFFLTFGGFDTPLPRFLGRVDSEEAYEGLSHNMHHLPQERLNHLSAADLQYFKNMMDKVYNSFKVTKNKDPEAAKLKRVERQKNLGRVTKRVQRYLGLRARAAYASHFGKSSPIRSVSIKLSII